MKNFYRWSRVNLLRYFEACLYCTEEGEEIREELEVLHKLLECPFDLSTLRLYTQQPLTPEEDSLISGWFRQIEQPKNLRESTSNSPQKLDLGVSYKVYGGFTITPNQLGFTVVLGNLELKIVPAYGKDRALIVGTVDEDSARRPVRYIPTSLVGASAMHIE